MPLEKLKILIVDDDEDDYRILRDLLQDIPDRKITTEWVSSFEKGCAAIKGSTYDVCFFDYRLGPQTGLNLLEFAFARGYNKPIILLTGYGEHEVDLEAMRLGAADYLVKDQINAPLLERSIRYSIHRSQSLESIRSLLDSTFEGIIVYDLEGTILNTNQPAAEIFGRFIPEMLGSKLFELFDGDYTQALALPPVQTNFEAIGLKRDGARVDLEVSAKSYNHQGQKAGLLAIRDVTEKNKMEAQILMQDRLASVGLLASSLAHEIGTPLGVVRGRAEYLALQSKNSPNVVQTAEVIISQIDRIAKLIRSLLNLARGDQVRNTDKIRLNQVVEEVLELVGHELERHSIQVQIQLKKDTPVFVKAEAQPLHQVLLNLIVNSIHAVEKSKKDGRTTGHYVEIGVLEGDEQWTLYVKDSGCGISSKNMANLFKPFFTTKEIGIGTGLGLATSYRIVESWGGTIQVESQAGVGTTFSVLLPKMAT